VIDVASRAVEYRRVFEASWPSTRPTTLGTSVNAAELVQSMTTQLVREAAFSFLMQKFPVTAIAVDGDVLTLSQGESSLQPNERYELVQLGEELIDPQTRRTLGRQETRIGIVEITEARAEVSFGRLVDGGEVLASNFVPGSVRLGAKVELEEASPPPQQNAGSPPARSSADQEPPIGPLLPSRAEPSASDSDW
jgi:hypothetical protein